MLPKPKHLGREYAEQFQDRSVVEAYPHRPTYSDETIRMLAERVLGVPRVVLDVGCGIGDIARRLASQVERVDAVDFSAAMLAKGKTLPGGDHPNLHWIFGTVEEVELSPPYGMVTAGASLHWLDWPTVFRRFEEVLLPGGLVAIVEMAVAAVSWQTELNTIINRFSTNHNYRPCDICHELRGRGLFDPQGELRTESAPFRQSVESYIESFHARNGLSRDRMTPEAAAAFDTELRAIVSPYCPDGMVDLKIAGSVMLGLPMRANP